MIDTEYEKDDEEGDEVQSELAALSQEGDQSINNDEFIIMNYNYSSIIIIIVRHFCWIAISKITFFTTHA